jgi:hypothetical protein
MKTLEFRGFTLHNDLVPIAHAIKQLDRWNKTKYGRRKILNESVLEESAKYAHDHNLIYLVTILENEKPVNYIEASHSFYSVRFLDDHLREYMTYQFYGQDNNYGRENYGDKLFLEDITVKHYLGDANEHSKIAKYRFRPDGTLKYWEADVKTRKEINLEAANNIDVSANWETYPAFGNYENLIKIERGLDMKI